MIRNLLSDIWLAKPETARRVRQRLGPVLDWAYASGYRDSEAPMRAITKGLPRQPKKERHFAAMPYAKVPAFMVRLTEIGRANGCTSVTNAHLVCRLRLEKNKHDNSNT